jgi:hypothetical protein
MKSSLRARRGGSRAGDPGGDLARGEEENFNAKAQGRKGANAG